MESTKRAIKFQLNESKVTILVFAAVILIINIFWIVFPQIFGFPIGINMDGYGVDINVLSLMALNFIPIICHYIVHNYVLYYKNFPISLSFSVTRKDFFKSMMINNIIIAFLVSTIQSILMKIDPLLVSFIGKEPYYEFGLFNSQTDNILFIIISIFTISILFIAIWNLIAALNYKFGPKFWGVLGMIFLLIPPNSRNIIRGLMFLEDYWMNVRVDSLQFTKLSVISILLYILIYFIIINTNIKNKV